MGSHSALQRHGRGSEIDSFDVSIMNSFALDPKLSLLVTSSSGGMPSELFQRLLRVSTFCVEAPVHRFGEREYGDVFEKPNGRRNRIVIRMADFFQCTVLSHKNQYPLSQQYPWVSASNFFSDGRVLKPPPRRQLARFFAGRRRLTNI